jgi:hypothetical protein
LLRYPSRRHRQPLTKTQIVQIPMTYWSSWQWGKMESPE